MIRFFSRKFQRARKLHPLTIALVGAGLLIAAIGLGAITYLSQQETRLTPQAQNASELRLMSYNLHGSIIDRENKRSDQEIIAELKSVAAYIKQHQIDIAALQEVTRMSRIDDVKILRDELERIGYPMNVTENVHKNQWSDNRSDNQFFTALFHKNPSLGMTYTPRMNLPNQDKPGETAPWFGSTATVLDTPVGKVRIFQHHPLPWISIAAGDELLKFVDTHTDNIPAIIMSDTNIFFENPSSTKFGPIIAKFLEKFFKACDKTIFPNNHCHDTVVRAEDWEIDQILIDKRLKARVVNSWVDTSRGNWPQEHSDHYAVFATLVPTQPATAPNCSNLSGPTQLQVGQTGTYTATVFSPQQDLRGEIFRNNFVSMRDQQFGAVNTATLRATWTPRTEDIGTHTIHCRAWNDAVAECRPPSLVDGPPRYACEGPGYSLSVTVVPASTPSPNPTPTPSSQQQLSLSLQASPLRSGTVSGAGTYQYGATVRVTAQPNRGYRFTGWTENNRVVSNELTYQFSITANRTLIATFAPVTTPTPTPTTSIADINLDGYVNIFDYNILISQYGQNNAGRSDINKDGTVNALDIQVFLEEFGN